MKIEWSQRSIADLVGLHEYIARDSPAYAERLIARLIRATEPLADLPEMGRHVPEEPEQPGLLELLVQSYRIVYRIEAERVLIATVVHGSRDLERSGDKPWTSG